MMNEESDSDAGLVREQAYRVLAGAETSKCLLGLLERRGVYDAKSWAIAQNSGWLGIGLTEAEGGLGLGLGGRCILAEEIGRALASIPFTPSSCVLSAIVEFGTSADRSAWVPGLAAGQTIGTLACFEQSDSGIPPDPGARFKGGTLTGYKNAVCAGAFANLALIHAVDDGGLPVIVLIDLAESGVSRHVPDTLDNSRGYADLSFSSVPALRLGGQHVLRKLLTELAIMTAFEQIGGAKACLDLACDYARERRAFGQPIGAFQAIKHSLADLYVLIELARGAALSALNAPSHETEVAAAAARLAATRAYDQAAEDSIQIHAGAGVVWEEPHQLHYRRARCLALEWAGPPYWRDRLLGAVLAGG